MKKKEIFLFFCTVIITFGPAFNAWAWELVDRDGDGVEESVLFCNGEYDTLDGAGTTLNFSKKGVNSLQSGRRKLRW